MNGKGASSSRSLWKVVLVIATASLVGPLLAWALWPPSSHTGSAGDYAENLVGLLWPTKILALGTPELGILGKIVLLLTNSVLYLASGSLSVAAMRVFKIRPRYAFQFLITIPVVFQLWFAGFDLQFVQWGVFIPAAIFY